MTTWKKHLLSGGVIWWLSVAVGALVILLLIARRLYG